MFTRILLAGSALLSVIALAGCDAGNVLLTTGAIGGNLELLQVIAQVFGFTTPPV
jgi:hypothetical protein